VGESDRLRIKQPKKGPPGPFFYSVYPKDVSFAWTFVFPAKRVIHFEVKVIVYAALSMRMTMVSAIPRKHAHSLQRLHSLAFGCGTFAYAKDQASLPHDGLLKDYPTPYSND
jgi:hypothetical protein